MTERNPWMQTFLDELCADTGFCLPAADCARLGAEPPGDPDALTDAIFVAEGFGPNRGDQTLWRAIRARVAARFHTLINPEIVEDIGPLLESLAKLGFYVTGARYDGRVFGNYTVTCVRNGASFVIIRDRKQYMIDAPLNSRVELRTAVLMYVTTL